MPKRKKADLKTVIGVVVDESGSMHVRQEETISAFNYYFDEIEKENPDAVVTVGLFSDMGTTEPRVRFLSKNTKVTDIDYLDTQNYRPRGNTPLFDAVGQVVSEISSEKADRYLVVILTDGLENASREYNKNTIQDLIKQKERTDNWTFVYLAADQDAWSGAQLIGMSHIGNTFAYAGVPGGTKKALRSAAVGTRDYLVSANAATQDFFVDDIGEEPKRKRKRTSSV